MTELFYLIPVARPGSQYWGYCLLGTKDFSNKQTFKKELKRLREIKNDTIATFPDELEYEGYVKIVDGGFGIMSRIAGKYEPVAVVGEYEENAAIKADMLLLSRVRHSLEEVAYGCERGFIDFSRGRPDRMNSKQLKIALEQNFG